MKLTAAFFRLIRWPNLLFIIITQILFYYCVFAPLLPNFPTTQNQFLFFLLIVASVCIAAAGYIINDYFDVRIDTINKPNKLIINKIIKRRWAIVWHLALSAVGILLSIYVGFKIKEWLIAPLNLLCVTLLLFYSTTFKRKLLIGNVLIALLTAWVIVVVYFFAGADLFSLKGWANGSNNFNVQRLFKYTLLYAGFAFIMTLIREVIKDLEDMEGDRLYQCNTMPIAWGVPAAKVFTAVWIVVCIAALFVVQLYAWQLGWWWVSGYLFLLITTPLCVMLQKLYKANNNTHYHQISSLVKLVMLFGILSMGLLKLL